METVITTPDVHLCVVQQMHHGLVILYLRDMADVPCGKSIIGLRLISLPWAPLVPPCPQREERVDAMRWHEWHERVEHFQCWHVAKVQGLDSSGRGLEGRWHYLLDTK